MTLEEVAEFLRVHSSTIYRLLKKHRIPAFKMGSDWRFNQESIERWIRERESGTLAAEILAESADHQSHRTLNKEFKRRTKAMEITGGEQNTCRLLAMWRRPPRLEAYVLSLPSPFTHTQARLTIDERESDIDPNHSSRKQPRR